MSPPTAPKVRALALALALAAPACSPATATQPDATVTPDVFDPGLDAIAPVDAAVDGDARSRPATVRHESAPVDLAPGQEITSMCESFTLNNSETLYVNSVTFESTAGMHHSNWLFVPQSYFTGPDGAWRCRDRGYDQGIAAAAGGVLFAQSTQATAETQRFPRGHVIAIPPRSRIVGQVHYLNATAGTVRTRFRLNVEPIPRDEVVVRLRGLYLEYGPLAIAPRARTAFTTTCDFGALHRERLMRPLDFRMFYGLPHYHDLGRTMRVQVVGGPMDGRTIFQSNAALGDASGQVMDPPIDLTGATGLRLTCVFDNPRDATVRYGVGDQEMCIFLGFTDSPLQWAGTAPHNGANTSLGAVDGVNTLTSPCTQVFALTGHGS